MPRRHDTSGSRLAVPSTVAMCLRHWRHGCHAASRRTRWALAIDDYQHLELPRPHVDAGGELAGEVIYQDRFGNLITNIAEAWVTEIWGPPPWQGIETRHRGIGHSRAGFALRPALPPGIGHHHQQLGVLRGLRQWWECGAGDGCCLKGDLFASDVASISGEIITCS